MSYLFPSFTFIILSGFIFNASIPWLRYKTRRHGGNTLILSSLITGLCLYTTAYFFIVSAKETCAPDTSIFCALIQFQIFPWTQNIYGALSSIVADKELSQTIVLDASIGSLLIAITLLVIVWLGQKILPDGYIQTIRRMTVIKEIKIRMGAKGALVNRCFSSGSPILITLSNRKVYVGYVLSVPYTQDREDWEITILPLRSGFREDQDLHLRLTQNYESIWDDMSGKIDSGDEASLLYINKLRAAGVTINWDDITTVSEWIPEIYKNFNA